MPNWGGGLTGGASGALTGAKFGSFIPGIGTGIGAAIGGIGGFLGGLFGGGKKKKQQAASPTAGNFNYDAIRQRAVQPVRSMYSSAKRELSRNRALQGGYAPGYQTMLGRMAREQSSAASDAAIGAEAEIARLQQGDRQLALQEKGLPSDYQRKLTSIGGTMDLIGAGAGALGTAFPNLFQGRDSDSKLGGGGITGGSGIMADNLKKGISGLFR